jgi:hypothetical protein
MTVKLVMADSRIQHLEKHLGEGRIKILEAQEGGYSYIEFEIIGNCDVLSVFHAGTDAGLELGLYGTKGKPVEEAKDLVELERG